MLTLENEYYIRLILLILRGGTLVLRQILLKKLEDQNFQLSRFLQINRETINRLKKDNVLTLKQYHILFPNNGTMTYICKLDISLLSCLLINMFATSMQRSEEKAVENIRTLRNDFTAHHPDGSIDARTFFNKWNQLSTSIMNLGKQLSSEQSSALEEMIRCIGKDPIDIARAIKDIRDATSITDQFLEQVSQQLEQLSLTVQRLYTCQEDTLAEIRKLEVGLRTVIENGNSDISTVIVGEVTVSGRNPEAVTAAAATLIDHAKRSKGYINRLHEALQSGREGITNKIHTTFASVKGHFWKTDLPLTQNEESKSQARVTSLVQDIYDAGGEVIDVTEGSLLLHIRCQSVAVMLAVLEYFRSSVLEQRLNDIEKCLTEESGCKINLTASIQIKSLQEALHTIQEKQTPEFTKTVRFSIKCQNAEGVLNVFNVFEGNSGSDNISKLAEGLSNEVGGPVTLRTSVDTDTVRQYTDDALEKIEAEHGDIDLNMVENEETDAENVRRENTELLIEISHLCNRRDRAKVENVLLLGKSGAGKSALVNTVIKAITGKYIPKARVGAGITQSKTLTIERYKSCGVRKEDITDGTQRDLVQGILHRLPTILDAGGIEDINTKALREILELLIGGYIPPGTSIEALEELQKQYSIGTLKNEVYTEPRDEWKVTKVVFVQSCRDAVPQNLVECLHTVLKTRDPKTAQPLYTGDVFVVMTKYDLVKNQSMYDCLSGEEMVTMKEFQQVEKTVIKVFNIQGALEDNRIRWVSYTDRDYAENPYIDNIALKFIKRMIMPGNQQPDKIMKPVITQLTQIKLEARKWWIFSDTQMLLAMVCIIVATLLYKLLTGRPPLET